MTKSKLKLPTLSLLLLLFQAGYLHPALEERPDKVFSRYLTHLQSGEYSKMYDMLSSRSRLMTSRWEFIRAHEKMGALFTMIEFSVYDREVNGGWAKVWYWITTRGLFGHQGTQDKTAHLVREDNTWKLETVGAAGRKTSDFGAGQQRRK